MENQHRLIKTYRDLSQQEIDLMNQAKTLEAHVAQFHAKIVRHVEDTKLTCSPEEYQRLTEACPDRWLAISQTHFDQAFMALVRAVAQPLRPTFDQSTGE